MPVPYLVYDVFTETAFGGNQLAIFPDARGLPQEKLQQIAAEFNFAEVTFVYPPKDPAHSARVRIFTPTSEIDFAGHPTIGTAVALGQMGYDAPMVLELGIGPVPCIVNGGQASFTVSNPLQTFAEPSAADIAAALGLPEAAIQTHTHAPIQASLGLPFALAELTDREALRNIETNVSLFKACQKKYPVSLDFAIFAYVRDGGNIDSRMFAPLDNIPEDPATGSASATLAALLTDLLGAPQNLSFTQGEDMGRLSKIEITTTQDPVTVTVSGSAVKVMEGVLLLS